MIELQRYDGPGSGRPNGDPPALHWVRSSVSRFVAVVACKRGHPMTLRQHQVKANGEVSPSVCCPLCDWHEWVKLAGWP